MDWGTTFRLSSFKLLYPLTSQTRSYWILIGNIIPVSPLYKAFPYSLLSRSKLSPWGFAFAASWPHDWIFLMQSDGIQGNE